MKVYQEHHEHHKHGACSCGHAHHHHDESCVCNHRHQITAQADVDEGTQQHADHVEALHSDGAGGADDPDAHPHVHSAGSGHEGDGKPGGGAAQCDHAHAHHDHDHDHQGSCSCGHEHVHGHGCDCGHDHGNTDAPLWPVIAGGILFAAGWLAPVSQGWRTALMVAAYLLLGGPVLWEVAKHFGKGGLGTLMDENFLMALATVGAWCIGDHVEAVAVMLFYRVGEAFQAHAISGAQKSIDALTSLRADTVHVVRDGSEQTVHPSEVQVGEEIVIRAGENVPLDAQVLSGESFLDTSALTGESVPVRVQPGDAVLSGAINTNGVLRARVQKRFEDSAVSKVLELTRQASENKAPAEKFITKFARVYTPCVVLAAVLVAAVPPLLLGQPFAFWLHKALSFLVVSCPCALVISVPMAYFAGIGMSSRRGLLVKGGEHFHTLAQADTIVFDKTGTLTRGVFTVSEVVPEQGVTPDMLLYLCASVEALSNHPVAQSIVRAQTTVGAPASDPVETAGEGITAKVDGMRIACGNARLMKREGVQTPQAAAMGTTVFVARDGQYIGRIVVSDQIREDAKKTIQALHVLGVRRTAMLTGDQQGAAQAVASELGLSTYRHSLLPEDKWAALRELRGTGPILFVGDGINDAPVLAAADAGVAMGGVGQDAAIQSADMVLMTDRLMSLCDGIEVARRTRGIVMQNIAFSLVIKAAVLLAAVLFTIPIWLAVFADVGVALLCVGNAARILRMKRFH